MVCSAGVSLAQTGIPIGPAPGEPDPTQGTPLLCESLYVPDNGAPFYCEGCCGLTSWPGALLAPGNSWGLTYQGWNRDRRPAVVIQFASAGWRLNPRGLVDWWWPTPHSPATLDPDTCIDEMEANDDLNSPIELLPHVNGNGVPDQFEVLIRRIKQAYAKGIRRVIFHEPAGVLGVQQSGWSTYNSLGQRYPIYGGTDQSMNQFLSLPQWKQDYFRGDLSHPVYYNYQDQFGTWQSRLMTFEWQQFVADYCTMNPDAEPDKMSLEIYVGGGVGTRTCKLNTSNTAPNPNGTDQPHLVQSFRRWNGIVAETEFLWSEPITYTDPPQALDPRRGDQMGVFWSEIKPWHDVGITTIWLDAVSENSASNPRRWGSLETAHSPYLTSQHIRLGGETFPTIDPSAQVPDDCALANMRWLTNSQVVMDNFYINGQDNPNRTFKSAFQLSKSGTECILLDNSNNLPLRWNELREARQRGFVVGLWWGEFGSEIERIKRWYSLGDIRVADFNGDGVVNLNDTTSPNGDYQMALNAISGSHTTNDPVVFATGDIDQNSAINGADWTLFLYYWSAAHNSEVRTYQFRD